jgi:integrase
MAKNVPFTPATIDALSRGKLRDPQMPGLWIEVLPSGKKAWKYERRVARNVVRFRLTFGHFPARSIADAREWAAGLNAQVEAGIDPRKAMRAEEMRNVMTVARAHGLYMVAVGEGRASRAKRKNRPRTIADKQGIYDRDIAPTLAKRSIYEVTEDDLIDLVTKKGKTAKVRANRLAAELKVFFGWAAGLRGREVGLQLDPSRRLGDLRFPETPRERALSLVEIEWFLRALVDEPRDYRRGQLLWLLTAARRNELALARREELVDDIWTIPAGRSKNAVAHSIALGPWGLALMSGNGEWIFPAERVDGPRRHGWYKSIRRVRERMAVIAGQPIERFSPHDFRRTARSNTKRLKVDFETAEAMLNHVKTGLARTYDRYEMEEEKRAWFLKWEQEIAAIVLKAGLAAALELPEAAYPRAEARPPSMAGPLQDILRPIRSMTYGAVSVSYARRMVLD